MAAFLVSQLTVSSYMVDLPLAPTISLRLLLLVLVGLILWLSRERFELGPGARRVLIPAAILTGTAIIANVTNSGVGYAFDDFRNFGAGLLIVILLASVVRQSKDLKILSGVVLVCVTASAIVGILQHYQFTGLGQDTLIPGFLQRWEGDAIRVPGMAETELELSYVLAAAVPVLLAVYIFRGMAPSSGWTMIASIALIASALYFTYTRSALLALVFGLVALVMFRKTRIRGEVVLAGSLLVMLTFSMTGILEGRYVGERSAAGQQASSISRMVLWQAGLAIAEDHPILGIGGDKFTEVAPRYSSRVDSSLLAWEGEEYWGYQTLGNEAVHNDFLTVWVSYGTLALAAYLWLVVATLRNLLDSHRMAASRFVKGLSLGLAAALVTYGTNAFYHNVFAALPLLWILAGFSVACAKLALTWRDAENDLDLDRESGIGNTNA